MKVAVSASGKELDAPIDPRFGRCAYFMVVDTDDMSFEAFDNENIALGGGAGIQSAQFVASKGAKVVLTGNVGPNAVQTLSAAGVEVIVGQTGTVREAIDNFKKGNLTSTAQANVSDHFGMGGNTAMGAGSGAGMGRGMGGGGAGMGRGMGMGRGPGYGRRNGCLRTGRCESTWRFSFIQRGRIEALEGSGKRLAQSD
ncbi:MAG: NifB/NifX family molybdenum-iron cluster-binding protein [Deltaproteobacteria bacterium]|nr:NifB/NifX family molybdenum-iron cluster-binding protein [Deltaproteobacteria bacterium]